MFIDIHVHTTYWKREPREELFPRLASPEELIAGYDRIGVEKAAILPIVSPEGENQLETTEEILAVCSEHPDRFFPFCNVDPRGFMNSDKTPMGRILMHYRKLGCRGIGEVTANMEVLDPMVQNLFAGAQEADLPLTFHIAPSKCGYGLIDQAGLPQLEESLKRFPDLRFMGHSQTFWGEIAPITCENDRYDYPKDGTITVEGRIPQLMRSYPNLYGDLSAFSGYYALKRDRSYAARFLTEFQDRLLFGTDICNPEMPILTPLAELLTSMRDNGEISETVFRKVARENAIRIYRLNQ